MAPTLRKSTQDKTQASADAAIKKGFVRRPPPRRPGRAPLPRHKRYASTKGLVNLKKTWGLQHITIANANSPLLRLPPEFRNMIFKYTLTSKVRLKMYFNSVRRYSRSGFSTRPPRSAVRQLGMRLPEVCRQIYSETATLVYRKNTFSFAVELGMRTWLKKRLPAQLEAIERLELLEGDTKDRDRVCKELRETVCPNIRCLIHKSDAGFVGKIGRRRMDWDSDYISTDDEETWAEFGDGED
ncbi:hypothetical protein C7974DRAFT_411751 [Boeremia exigua]|uniref:uncharacterized protein n=1 Tax=Boeremia exigua TaxID=749465 RepID=UPI001E8E05E8|nr:uncharacterized protein C7974DRAFT_411751 [Boeremia exigua]KAH6638321.1 hypothetical protein C7974DRAFT_411751 [Boeremia exigua]